MILKIIVFKICTIIVVHLGYNQYFVFLIIGEFIVSVLMLLHVFLLLLLFSRYSLKV